MTGWNHTPSRLRIGLAGAALFTIFAMGTGHAQQELTPAAPKTQTALANGPVFVPSADAEFVDAFDHLPAPAAEPHIPAHAVDLDTFEPPVETAARSIGSGVASYYGRRFAGRPTANGETFDPARLTAAHRTLPFGSKVRVTNPRNGRSVVVRINDRGPFHGNRTIDLSRAAAEQVGIVQAGHGTVELELLDG